MLKVAYHAQTNEQPLGSARSLGTDELKHSHGNKQRGETIEELKNDESQVGVVDWVVCCLARVVERMFKLYLKAQSFWTTGISIILISVYKTSY